MVAGWVIVLHDINLAVFSAAAHIPSTAAGWCAAAPTLVVAAPGRAICLDPFLSPAVTAERPGHLPSFAWTGFLGKTNSALPEVTNHQIPVTFFGFLRLLGAGSPISAFPAGAVLIHPLAGIATSTEWPAHLVVLGGDIVFAYNHITVIFTTKSVIALAGGWHTSRFADAVSPVRIAFPGWAIVIDPFSGVSRAGKTTLNDMMLSGVVVTGKSNSTVIIIAESVPLFCIKRTPLSSCIYVALITHGP
jgi:hypothetical protein